MPREEQNQPTTLTVGFLQALCRNAAVVGASGQTGTEAWRCSTANAKFVVPDLDPRERARTTLGLSIGRCTTPTERGSAGSTQPRFTARLRTRAPRDRRDPDRHTTVKSVGHDSRRRRCPFPRRCYHVDRSPVVVLVDESEEVICHTRHRGRAQTHVAVRFTRRRIGSRNN
jgi:hypothetical protein